MSLALYSSATPPGRVAIKVNLQRRAATCSNKVHLTTCPLDCLLTIQTQGSRWLPRWSGGGEKNGACRHGACRARACRLEACGQLEFDGLELVGDVEDTLPGRLLPGNPNLDLEIIFLMTCLEVFSQEGLLPGISILILPALSLPVTRRPVPGK